MYDSQFYVYVSKVAAHATVAATRRSRAVSDSLGHDRRDKTSTNQDKADVAPDNTRQKR